MPPKKIFTGDWYPWYFNRVMGSERVENLSLAEYGAYRRALDIQWQRGWMPADPKKFAEVVGKKCTVQIARKVMQFFANVRGSRTRCRNQTLEKIRSEQEEIHAVNVQRARDAATKRWKKEKLKASPSNAPSMPQAMLDVCKEDERRLDDIKLKELSSSSSSFRSREKKSELIDALKKDPRFTHLDIQDEFDRAVAWAVKHEKTLTEFAFMKWLERAEPPLVKTPPKAKAKGVTRNGTVDFYALEQKRAIEERDSLKRLREIDRRGSTTLPDPDDPDR